MAKEKGVVLLGFTAGEVVSDVGGDGLRGGRNTVIEVKNDRNLRHEAMK